MSETNVKVVSSNLQQKNELQILKIDPWLEPHRYDLEMRMNRYKSVKDAILGELKSFKDFANGHHYFGIHKHSNGWIYREWAPEAESLSLVGDFNNWNTQSHPLQRKDNGIWEITLDKSVLCHKSFIKVFVKSKNGSIFRIPLYIRRVVQDETTKDFTGQIWDEENSFNWTDYGFKLEKNPIIYETHIGMAQEKEGIGTYKEFEDIILPRIKSLGYNTIQLMAILEHPYYGSFGYHVSNFFAVSSRFGTPEELKSLINKAHSMGIAVLMDMVHSHAVKNFSEGINEFDGTEYQFFHTGHKGYHVAWDSKLFNYGKHEVIHFLLSNLKFWMEEYHFDGFRFDGITSMIYHDHGLGSDFDNYNKYFSLNTDVEAITYLQFANELIKEINPNSISIAEDMSGMPGMCLPVEYGGIGFDYRLSMGMPDFWIKYIKVRDEDWNMNALYHELSTSRPEEKRIGYIESHDQALVGDKTFIFWMADKEMYWHMNKGSQNLLIDRAIALHKMCRLITISLGCDGYLNFMGNEFGHPEWVDFPREGNGWSYKHCRRKWYLADDEELRYSDLYKFDREMIQLFDKENLLGPEYMKALWVDNDRKLIALKKKEFIFVFNFHPSNSYDSFEIPIHEDGIFEVVLNTDENRFGGFNRISNDIKYTSSSLNMNNEFKGITLYSPSRTAIVLKRIGF